MELSKEYLMQRCFDLARLGLGKASPNPLVGAVISMPNIIIGEGYHMAYGKAHAEVNAVDSVTKKNLKKIKKSFLSVSLEPCNFHGKTPACTNLIIQNGIPHVNISTLDKTNKVNSKGIQKLKENGLQVDFGIMEPKGKFLARVRNTFVTKKRPYIILKFAQSKDGFMGQADKQIWLTNKYSKRLVHKWRSEIAAIMVGTNTALVDKPALTNRLYSGSSPLRVILDKDNSIAADSKLKDKSVSTWIYTSDSSPGTNSENLVYKDIPTNIGLLDQICSDLFADGKDTLMVEGGPKLINSFIAAGLWDEARILNSPTMLKNGLKSPQIDGVTIANFPMYTDVIELKLSHNNVIYS